jgi:hypothetical protein
MTVIQVNFGKSQREDKNGVPATDEDLIALAQKFSEIEIPYQVFLQAIAIAAYDVASAFRYADNYLNGIGNGNKRKTRLWRRRNLQSRIQTNCTHRSIGG